VLFVFGSRYATEPAVGRELSPMTLTFKLHLDKVKC